VIDQHSLAANYELLDFGDGRILERFAGYCVDRPAPVAANHKPAMPSAWQQAAARFERRNDGGGTWQIRQPPPDPWRLAHGRLLLELGLTPAGQVGVFAEQIPQWRWLEKALSGTTSERRVLNLFGYTGAGTLQTAALGATVTHVDASSAAVAWARRNAAWSMLQDAPIRWLVEDGPTVVRRELTRVRRYHGVILDPPSYGHGPDGQPWKIDRDLHALLADCMRLLTGPRPFVVLTCHTIGYDRDTLVRLLGEHVCDQVEAGDLGVTTSGAYARWIGR